MFKNRTFPRDRDLSPRIIIWGNEHLHSLISPSTHSGADLTAKTQSFQCRGSKRRREGCSLLTSSDCGKKEKTESGDSEMCISVFTSLGS